MRNALFQFTGILLTSIVFKLFDHESMVGFLHFKVSYPTTHLINSLMLYRIQIYFSLSSIQGSRNQANSLIDIYTFIHLDIFAIKKSQNLLASRTGNPGQSHMQPEIACCNVGFEAIILL